MSSTQPKAYADDSIEMNCGSISSSKFDDNILGRLYDLISRQKEGKCQSFRMRLRFRGKLESGEELEKAFQRRIEELNYRNFFDWSSRLVKGENRSYWLQTRQTTLEVSVALNPVQDRNIIINIKTVNRPLSLA